MNNLEVILQSIINEGNTEKDQILDEANARANEIIGQSKKEAENEARKIIDDAKKQAQNIRANEAVSSERARRDIEISAKNEAIDSVVEGLLENLKNLDTDSYKRFVENTLAKSKITSGELLLAEKHKDALKDSDFKGLKIADQTVEDGFVVRSGKIEYDNRFSSIIKYSIDDIRKQISDEIFK